MAELKSNTADETQYFSNITKFLYNIYISIFSAVGLFGVETIKVLIRFSDVVYNKFMKRYVIAVSKIWLRFLKFNSKIVQAIKFKFYSFLEFFISAKNVVANGYNSHPDSSIPIKLLFAAAAFFKGLSNNIRIFVTIFNYALPVAAVAALFALVQYVSGLNFAVAVTYNGEHIGYIESEKVFESAGEKLQNRMVYLEDDETIDYIPKFTVAIVDDEKLKTDSEITDAIITSSAGEIVKATGLTIDGEFYGAVKDGVALTSALADMLNKYKTGNPDETVEFAKDVKTETGIFKATNIVHNESLVAKLTNLEQKDVYYEVEAGDTPIMIAAKNDMTLDELVAYNSDILTNCKIGKQVLVKRPEAFLPVKVIRQETYEAEIDYEITYVDSNKLYKGQSITSRAGVKGAAMITDNVEYIDGIEVGRSEISRSVVSEPVPAVVERGTMSMPTASAYVASAAKSDYGLIWPVSGGYISQYYGNYGHNGIDYAYRGNGYGQPIVASLPGTVSFSGWNGSYGNLVIIDSPGGVQTWYAHCSSLLVSSGQTVSQGQQIARIGSTGRSTGNHLHFRVLVNGVQRNPMNYLP